MRELLELDRRNHFASSFQFNFAVVFMTLANTVLIGRMSNGQGVFSAFCQFLLLFFVKPPVSNARNRRESTNHLWVQNQIQRILLTTGLESDHSRGFRFGHSDWGFNLGNQEVEWVMSFFVMIQQKNPDIL